MRCILLDARTQTRLYLSEEQHRVVLAYANLFCGGNLGRAVTELARREKRRRLARRHFGERRHP